MRGFRRAGSGATGVLGAAVLVAAGCQTPAPAPTPWGIEGEAFGTTWMVRIRAPQTDSETDPETDPAPLRRAIEEELDAVDRAMSNWRPDSEISRLNAAADPGPTPVSEPLAEVLAAALEVHRDSGGAFDITVGPLLRLHGFGPGGDSDAPAPDPAEVAAARARVGSGLLSLERTDGAPVLRRRVPGVELDLSGIAKGYAVDRVSAALTRLGFPEHLVEIGGEIRTQGAWTVGVQDPGGRLATRAWRTLAVRDLALATSGGYRDFRPAADGENGAWTHILDPRLGRPVTRRLASVTVLAASCLTADAWATALYVLGPDEGLELAERRNLAALFLVAGPDGDVDGRITETATAAFERATGGPDTR